MKAETAIALALVVASALLVQACAANAVCSGEAEKSERIRDRIAEELPLRRSDAVVEYVRQFGPRLAARAGIDRDITWRFYVVRDKSANAFAIGDGRIYITEGAILASNSEAELAGVIAHEMGHQLAGHFCRDSSGSGHSAVLEGRRQGYASPSPSLGNLRQGMDPAKEREADEYSIGILLDAGYDPSVRSNVLNRSGAQVSDRPSYGARPPADYSRREPPVPATTSRLSPLERAKQLLRQEM
jgi:predicted Zn-dependent protease